MAIRIILDTDLAMGAPGSEIDDGFALALAVADPDLRLDLVTTVHGNTDVQTASELSRQLLRRLGRAEVAVVRGADRRLADLPPPRTGGAGLGTGHDGGAARALVDLVLSAPGEITVVAIGPLTNVALAIRAEPRFPAALGGLMIMGGAFDVPASRPGLTGEFNVWSDPQATAVVLAAGVTAGWVGLDVTQQIRITRAEAEEMAAAQPGDPDGACGPAAARHFAALAGRFTVAWIDHLLDTGRAGDPSCPLHDPLAVAAVAHPDLLTWRTAAVSVEVAEPQRGRVQADFGSASPNARVAVGVDAEAFTEQLRSHLARLPA